MKKKFYLVVDSMEYPLAMSSGIAIENQLAKSTPIAGTANNIGGEIYFLTDVDIPFNGDEKEIFDVGDVAYWRSQSEKKFAIAIFYGNTEHGNGNAPTAAGPCMQLASIAGDCAGLESISSGTELKLIYR